MKFDFFTIKKFFIENLNKKQNNTITNQQNKNILVHEEENNINIVDNFFYELDDINNITALELIRKIFFLTEEQKELVLSNEKIKTKLRKGFLDESEKEQYRYYDEVLMYLSPIDFLSLYDGSYLKDYFLNNKEVKIYKFFACLITNDLNGIISYVLKDEIMFEELFKKNNYFHSLFKGLDYILLRNVIFLMEKHNLKYKFDFISSISTADQISLLNENIKDDTILKILPLMSDDSINYFFKYNTRAKFLLSRFDIYRLVENGIEFSDEILKSNTFFDILKSHSFIQFRTNINNVEKINNPIFIEDNLKKYYEELIRSYNPSSKLFKEYDEILEKIKYTKINYGENFILSGSFIFKINKLAREDINSNIEEIVSILLQETSKKLSEVIIDAIFSDNIYNVFLNINEMIRYNELLDDDMKVLTKEKLEFYKLILSFDLIDNDEKIKIYNKLKNKNYNFIFYEDLRKLKDLSYNQIKEELTNPIIDSNYLDTNVSKRYGIKIYDLSNKEYKFLVRKQWKYQEISQYEANCYSLISNENNKLFTGDDTVCYIYGYNNFDENRIIHILEKDAFSSSCKDNCSIHVNRIMTPREIINSNTSYSEIQILNEKIEKETYKFNVLKPDYLLVFDDITDRVINESKRLNIPIVIISEKKLKQEDVIDIGLNEDLDIYVDNIYYEDKKRLIREDKLNKYLQKLKSNI